MLMLALLPIGLLALRCVDALATRFGDLLFNFFVLIISTLVAHTLLRWTVLTPPPANLTAGPIPGIPF